MAGVAPANSGDYTPPGSTPSTVYTAKTTTPSGFLEFKPRDMVTQTKYDAMSPSWEGIDSSMKAVERGEYALNSAETTRRDERPQYTPGELAPPPTATPPPTSVPDRLQAFVDSQPKPNGRFPTPPEWYPVPRILQAFVDSQPKPKGLLPPIGTCVIQ